MGIILLPIAICIVAFILKLVIDKICRECELKFKNFDYSYGADEVVTFITVMIAVIVAFFELCALIALVVCLLENMSAKSNLETKRASIETKIESGIYTDKLDLNDKEIVDEATAFNKDLLASRVYRNNVWTNWFYSDACNQVETIDLSKITHSESIKDSNSTGSVDINIK